MDGQALHDEAVKILRRLGPRAAVAALPLSYRLKTALIGLGVEVLSEAVELTERALMSRPGIGRKSLAELQSALAIHGLRLRDDAGAQQGLPLQPASIHGGGPLPAELEELLRFGEFEDADRLALLRLLGWDGAGGAPPRVIADALGLTVEHVRRLQTQASERLPAAPRDTPALDAALAILEETHPATLATAAAAIAVRGLSSMPFDPRGVLRAAKLLGRKTKLVVEPGPSPILTRHGFHDVAASVDLACSLALAGRAVATVDDVLINLSTDQDPGRWWILVADLVDDNAELDWLDEERRSFGRRALPNTVREAVARIVEREGQCPISAVLSELAGDPALGLGLDRALLERLCKGVPGVAIDGERIGPRRAPAPAEAPPVAGADLDAAARRAALVDVLRLRPQTSLAELCATEGDAGAWLRESTVVDLARAALEADLDRAEAPPPATCVRPPRPARAKPKAPRSVATSTVRWSSGASSLSLPLPRPSVPAPAELTPAPDEPKADRRTETMTRCDVIAVLQRASSPGLLMVELEAELPGPRSRLRRILRALEAEGIVRRDGVTRSTRYELTEPGDAAPAESAAELEERSKPIRRRRTLDDPPATRTVFYRRDPVTEPQKVAAVVLERGTIKIAYAPDQPRLDALERIATAAGVLTPSDGLRFWTALPSAFATSAHFFVADGADDPGPGDVVA